MFPAIGHLCRVALFCLPLTLFAGGSIKGKVLTETGEPIRQAKTMILDLKRLGKTDTEGSFHFADVPAGTYSLQISSDIFGNRIQEVTVADGQDVDIQVVFDISIHEDLTITATPKRKSVSDVAQAIGVMNETDLQQKMEPTLGETLAREPGVSATSFGAGSSRPVIRGLGGDRIRILEGGIGTGDASNVSADHAVTIDPSTAERVEILRGPASLRYGSNAIGGVVNVIDNRIPEFTASSPLSGSVSARGNSGSDEQAFAVRLNGGVGQFAYHADFSSTETEDYEIPSPPELEGDHEDEGEHEDEEPFNGTLENSALENTKGTLGLSYVTDRGFVGFSVTSYESDYGVPGHGHGHEEDGHDHDHEGEEEDDHEEDGHEEDEHGHEGEEEEQVRIDLDQRRIDGRGEIRVDSDFLDVLNMRIGYTDYDHQELEGDAIGTTFENEYLEMRGEVVHKAWGPFTSGSFGVQYNQRDFSAEGAEAFVPANENDTLAVYLYEEMDRGNWSIVVGSRFSRQNSKTTEPINRDHDHDHDHDHEGEDDHDDEGEHGEEDDHDHDDDDDHGDDDDHDEIEGELFDRDFDGLSASIGFVYGKESDYGFSTNVTYTERAPTPEELFSFGPHLATSAFEIGDPDLKKESSIGLDVQFRKKSGPVTGEISLFTNRFDDFIYEAATGEEADGLDEFAFVQEDAELYGGEAHLDISLLHSDPHHLHLELIYDYVRGELDSSGNLPRITPARFGVMLEYQGDTFWVRTEARVTEDQDDVANLETATEGYTFYNASAGYRWFVGSTLHQFLLRGNNLTDEEGRNHSSFLKDRVLLPGRNVTLSYQLKF
ncbi:TonB-dependent receptor [Sulfidibacter corallicola]|uniref:TonB-dependent receptor n=1 Tax=Sulfidibacter corallicola TaxID=2818388 RepID=A0A8A4TWU5_SULCO|nr:TonB-dependent receptor [Sulfidibacter corallicola]QTD53671.1 TonB-dependent receptor [Sulfidibacter corallicola]